MINTNQKFIPMLTDGKELFELSSDTLVERELMELTINNQQIYVSFYTSSIDRSRGEKPLRYCIAVDDKPYYVGFKNFETLQSMLHDKLNTIMDIRELV